MLDLFFALQSQQRDNLLNGCFSSFPNTDTLRLSLKRFTTEIISTHIIYRNCPKLIFSFFVVHCNNN